MIRALAGHDPARYTEVARWPLAEALIAYETLARAEQLEQFRSDRLLFALGGLKKEPPMPPLLRRVERS